MKILFKYRTARLPWRRSFDFDPLDTIKSVKEAILKEYVSSEMDLSDCRNKCRIFVWDELGDERSLSSYNINDGDLLLFSFVDNAAIERIRNNTRIQIFGWQREAEDRDYWGHSWVFEL